MLSVIFYKQDNDILVIYIFVKDGLLFHANLSIKTSTTATDYLIERDFYKQILYVFFEIKFMNIIVILLVCPYSTIIGNSNSISTSPSAFSISPSATPSAFLLGSCKRIILSVPVPPFKVDNLF